jgi:hypothetical protein
VSEIEPMCFGNLFDDTRSRKAAAPVPWISSFANAVKSARPAARRSPRTSAPTI